MKLKPVIASYSGESFGAIRSFLTEDVVNLVARVAASPNGKAPVSKPVLDELVEMHVLSLRDGAIKLDTAVFLEEDIRSAGALAAELGNGLAMRLADVGAELNAVPPEIRNFLGGIIGVGQGLHKVLKEAEAAFDWRRYAGRYAQSKVDFDEIGDALEAMGPDWQNKSILKGDRYTAVFIGPGGENYQAFVYPLLAGPACEFGRILLGHLTDSFAMLAAGTLDSPGLRRMAGEAGLLENGRVRPILVDPGMYRRYGPVIASISESSYQFYLQNLPRIFELLKATASGRQGVPPENMMMHFWRYCRRALAKELYESGFFSDQIRKRGCVTVFYDNTIRELDSLL